MADPRDRLAVAAGAALGIAIAAWGVYLEVVRPGGLRGWPLALQGVGAALTIGAFAWAGLALFRRALARARATGGAWPVRFASLLWAVPVWGGVAYWVARGQAAGLDAAGADFAGVVAAIVILPLALGAGIVIGALVALFAGAAER